MLIIKHRRLTAPIFNNNTFVLLKTMLKEFLNGTKYRIIFVSYFKSKKQIKIKRILLRNQDSHATQRMF